MRLQVRREVCLRFALCVNTDDREKRGERLPPASFFFFRSPRKRRPAGPTGAGVSRDGVQPAAVIVGVAGQVVAVGPLALHQERPRHVSGPDASASRPSSPRRADFIS